MNVVALTPPLTHSVLFYQFEWRNGWFYGLSKDAVKSGKQDPCPTHTMWLKEVGAV